MALGVLFLILFCVPSKASFEEHGRRYLSPRAIFKTLERQFPRAKKSKENSPSAVSCFQINQINRDSLGVNSPVLGRPISKSPAPSFIRWWSTCLETRIKSHFEEIARANNIDQWNPYVHASILDLIASGGDLGELRWQDLESEIRENQIKHTIGRIIGPHAVLKDLGYGGDLESLAETIEVSLKQSLSVYEAIQAIYLKVSLREETITF